MIELPNELQKVEKELKERRITGDEASNSVFLIRRKLGPPWHWKSWKVARAKVLDTQCKTCGAVTALSADRALFAKGGCAVKSHSNSARASATRSKTSIFIFGERKEPKPYLLTRATLLPGSL